MSFLYLSLLASRAKYFKVYSLRPLREGAKSAKSNHRKICILIRAKPKRHTSNIDFQSKPEQEKFPDLIIALKEQEE